MTAPCRIAIILVLISFACAFAEPEPGPENAGLRMRLIVSPESFGEKEGFNVRVDLINSSASNVTLHAGWGDDSNKGDLRDYIEAATSIESYPPIKPWAGSVGMGFRKSPQPKHVLKAGEVLTVNWQTEGRRLKNTVTDPNEAQNPEFLFDGLYSIHATLKLYVGEPPVPKEIKMPDSLKNPGIAFIQWAEKNLFLRSNEQLLSVGGSQELPKSTYGKLSTVRETEKTADLNLGALHKIQKGDQFEIRTGWRELWKLTVTQLFATSSRGQLEALPILVPRNTNLLRGLPPLTNTLPKFPSAGDAATLMRK